MSSEVAIYDLATASVQTVFQTDRLIEAPNWTADGTTLIVNGDGKLYRLNLAQPQLVQIDTGFATALNNDHGISPDATQLVISDTTEVGKSRIYTLPFSGGTPRLVQAHAPAYWHGWSPDGSRLVYSAKRGETFQIHTCPVNGGDEFQVTRDFDHADGPDYSPDGRWIWFNGEQAGSVQLWRIAPDGQGLQQMTADERVNWFPHPSPDGRHVLYLAYESGTQGHPRYRDVQLRLLPAEGGTPKVLMSMFGGQGTMNVPCWAPDSRKFAFVRYGRTMT